MSGAIYSPRTRTYPAPSAAPGGFVSRRVIIPDDPGIIAALADVVAYLARPGVWEISDDPGAVEEYQVRAWMAAAALGIIEGHDMIGSLVAYVTEAAPPGAIAADGSTYQAADYPLLWQVLDPSLRLDANSFFLPDLTDRVVIGATAGNNFQAGGADSITLTVDQLPPHTHTNQPHTHTNTPHSHSEGVAVPTIINGGIEAPASAAQPGISTTGLASVAIDAASVDIDPTGSGAEIDIRQTFIRLRYAVVAR